VEKFFGSRFPTNGIGLHHIRDYQRERREQISPTMKQPVTARTVNYEMHLLRSAMTFAGCWMPELEVGYQPVPLSLTRSRSADKNQKFDVNRPMTGWVKSWRKLTQKCNMDGFRFHDLRHTFRTLGAEAGVPLEVMMAQLGHMDRETSLEYVHIQQQALERAKQLIESE